MLCSFKPTGRGQRARRALLSPEMVTKAKAQIEAALGELVFFELITGDEQAEPELLSLVWGMPGSNFRAQSVSQCESRSWRMRWRPGILQGPSAFTAADAAA
jgi:hypothetical protein